MDASLGDDQVARLREAMRGDFAGMFADLHRFVDRRIAELSTELHCAVQLIDYSENNLSAQLGRVHDQVHRLIAIPTGPARNSGLELEAVVVATERAANLIMEAAEAIGEWVRSGDREPAALEAVALRVTTIFEACAFQDLTGQRIRRAIEQLQSVETLLGGMIGAGSRVGWPPAETPPDLGQDEIDRLLA